jgi:ATP-dependent Clp protease ATP-binding subunit ClpA
MYYQDMTRLARDGAFVRLGRREAEVARVLEVLARDRKNSPVLVGAPDGDWLPIVKEVVRRIAFGDAPVRLQDSRVFALDLDALITALTYRGAFEDRLKDVFAELSALDKQPICFVDDLGRLLGAGSAENCIDVALVLVPALAVGGIRVIGTMSMNDLRKYIEPDPSLGRRFQEVLVKESLRHSRS